MSEFDSSKRKRPSQYDVRCPDGFTCCGWRRVNPGGYVRFQFDRHYHEELAEYVGRYVWVEINDGWATSVRVYPYRHARYFVYAFNEKEFKESTCSYCGAATHADEAACLECGKTKEHMR